MPAFAQQGNQVIPKSSSGSGTVGPGLTVGCLPTATAATVIGSCSAISDNGTLISISENVAVTGALSASAFDNIVYVDGNVYPQTAAGINSASASLSGSPGIVWVPTAGNYSDVTIALTKGETLIFGAGQFTTKGITVPDSSTDNTGTSAIYGQGVDRTTIFLANASDVDVITDPNYATISGGTNFWGVYHTKIADLTINANKANQTGTSYGIRLYGRANFLSDLDIINSLNDGIYQNWTGTSAFSAVGDDLEWRITNVKTRFSGGNGLTDHASSDAMVDNLTSYSNGGWGVETFFSMHLQSANTYLNTSGGCHANGTGATSAGFFGSDDNCQSSSGNGLKLDASAGVGASNIEGQFTCNGCTAIFLGSADNTIVGTCSNATTCVAFSGASAVGETIVLSAYSMTTGPLVAFNSVGGDSFISITGGSSSGTMFDNAASTQGSNVFVNVVGITGNPYVGFSSASLHAAGWTPQLPASNGVLVVPNVATTFTAKQTFTQVGTATNCNAASSSAAVACGAAIAGQFSCDTSASGTTCVISTTAISATSEVFVQPNAADTISGVTCNTTSDTSLSKPRLASISAGTSFTLNLGTFSSNPECFDYWIVN